MTTTPPIHTHTCLHAHTPTLELRELKTITQLLVASVRVFQVSVIFTHMQVKILAHIHTHTQSYLARGPLVQVDV